jgi:1-acyl-sn-glycerol-3-phosphate acyltransferase
MLYAILKPCAVALMRLYFRIRRRGWQHVPATGPVLLVANHASLLDPPLIAGMTPRPVAFMAKAELFGIPLFGGLIRRLNANPVRRDGSDPSALRLALRLLEQGRALLVFPEGTRGADEDLREAKAGAGMLAVLSGAPVVPVYIQGTARAWPRGRTLPRPEKVTVWFGRPLRFDSDGGDGTRPSGDRDRQSGDRNRQRKQSYEVASREMMAAIARLKDAAGPGGDRNRLTGPHPASPREGRRVVGEVGAGGASASPKYIYKRSGQYGE